MMRQLSRGQPPRSAGFCKSRLFALSKHPARLLTFSAMHGQPLLVAAQLFRWPATKLGAMLPPAAAQTLKHPATIMYARGVHLLMI